MFSQSQEPVAGPHSKPKPSFMELPENTFLYNLQAHSKFKQRSHDTHHNIHIRELNARLNLSLDLPPPSAASPPDDEFTIHPDLSNASPISVIYLGNSMLERLKTSGKSTRIAQLPQSWNAGCGGDKNENILYRLSQGLYSTLASEQKKDTGKCDIKLWILASGTNNLHPKRVFRDADVKSWKRLVQACLGIAPGSRVVACDMFYRKDVPDDLVDRSNELLKGVVDGVNKELATAKREEAGRRVEWVEARHLISKDMLVDHVHLDEEGYKVWDKVLCPYIAAEGYEIEK